MATKKRVLVPLAEGFEEIEGVTAIDVLRRAGAEVCVAGLDSGPVKGSRGVVVLPETTLEDVQDELFDMVVLPGGMPGARHLGKDERLKSLLIRMSKENRWIGAICAAPALVLEPQGHLASLRATCHPSFRKDLKSFEDTRVVVDGRIVTSQAPGTALEFSIKLVEILFGNKKAEEIQKPMLLRQ